MNRIDLRTKLIFLLTAPLFMFLELPITLEIAVIIIYLSLFLLYKEYKWAIAYSSLYVFQLFLLFTLPKTNLHPFIFFTLSFFAVGLRRMLFSIISGTFLLKTTSISEWLFLLNKWHVPKGIKIGVAVMVRFVPTIINDFRVIKQAMAIRGIQLSVGSFFIHPIQTFEYSIIPLLMNTSFTARDLTISALTKGIQNKQQATSYKQYHMGTIDYILIAIILIGLVIGVIV